MVDLEDKAKYSKRVGNLCSDCSVLTASTLDDINQVFYADGVEQMLSATDLSIRYVTARQYHELIAGTDVGEFEPKTLYVVSSDEINAYNTQIKNVASPSVDYDAANKIWVEQSIAGALVSAADYSDALRPLLNGKLDRCKNGCFIDNIATIAYGSATDGIQTSAIGKYSVAIGEGAQALSSSYAFGKQSYALGNVSRAIGNNVSAAGHYSYVFGQHSYVNPNCNYSVAIGRNLSIENERSIALGLQAKTTANRQFVWNYGDSLTSIIYAPNAVPGTFNINPKDGISGFYIQDKNLAEILSSKIDQSGLDQLCSAMKIGYDSSNNAICLSAGDNITSVDCSLFMKDTRISNAQLCGTSLVLSFNGNVAPIDVEMSSLSSNYDEDIQSIQNDVSSRLYSSAIAPAWEQKPYVDNDIVTFNGNLYIVTDQDYISESEPPSDSSNAWALTSISAIIAQSITPLQQRINELTLSVEALSNQINQS